MVINDQPNMHMHESSFSVWYGLILQQAGVISNHQITRTPVILGAYLTLPPTPS